MAPSHRRRSPGDLMASPFPILPRQKVETAGAEVVAFCDSAFWVLAVTVQGQHIRPAQSRSPSRPLKPTCFILHAVHTEIQAVLLCATVRRALGMEHWSLATSQATDI